MTIFYSIISVLFFIFSYLISRENENSVTKSLLVGLLLFVAWPLILTVATVYLIIGRFRRMKADKEVNPENLSPSAVKPPMSAEDYEKLKAALNEEGGKSTEEIVEEQVNQNWEEIKD